MAQAFKFSTSVSEGVTDGGSTCYGVSVETDLPEYADHGEAVNPEAPQPPEGGDAVGGECDSDSSDAAENVLVKLSALTLIPERRISVRRTYTAFVALRDALVQRGVPGANELPDLPSKTYFSSADAKTVATRRAAFAALLQAIGSSRLLASAEPTCAFLSDVAKPDYAKVHVTALQRMRDVLALPSERWEQRYNKRDIEIAVQRVQGSQLYLIKSSVLVPLPVERTHSHYTHTPNWQRWTPDATFSEVERASPNATVLNCVYRMPVISDRDVVFYEAALQPDELPSDIPGSRGAVALSVQHPQCPVRRSMVRAHLLIAVTLFTPTPSGHTVITSIQHADPSGNIPARVVNAAVARGKTQLKEMRRVMVELG